MHKFKARNTPRAKKLRREAPPAERKIWQYLQKRQVGGLKFSRQMPVGPYFCDFLCREANLVIEIDGYSHEMQVQNDQERTLFLESQGLRVLRFSNDDVMAKVEGVIERILQFVREHNLSPIRVESHVPLDTPSRLREGSNVESPSRLREGRNLS